MRWGAPPKPIEDPKTCSKCGRKFPLTAEFWHRSKYASCGFIAECKRCRNRANRVRAEGGYIERRKAKIERKLLLRAEPGRSFRGMRKRRLGGSDER